MDNKRSFFKLPFQILIGLGILGLATCKDMPNKKAEAEEAVVETTTEAPAEKELFFKLSLAQWSLHKAIFAKEMDNLEFAAKAKALGFTGLEYVAGFFLDKAEDMEYLEQMKKNAEENGMESLLIMVDNQGDLADTDAAKRKEAVEMHHKWVDAAKYLGCHSIRVNLFGKGTQEEWHKAAVDGLGALAKYGQEKGINVIVENHGGFSSNSEWLVAVMKEINLDNCGTLPDFGNFCIRRDTGDNWKGNCVEEYDRYLGTEQMMPFAKAVSAKSYAFGEDGQETKIDYGKMLKIVQSHGYNGYIGVEYEGDILSEIEGIEATRDLLIAEGKKM